MTETPEPFARMLADWREAWGIPHAPRPTTDSLAYKQGWTAARDEYEQDEVEGIESYKRQVAYWRGVTGKQRIRAEKAEAELIETREQLATLKALLQDAADAILEDYTQ